MIPIPAYPEPPDFDHKVRRLGTKFLKTNPTPKDWEKKDYWTWCLPQLRKAYRNICVYSSIFEVPIAGSHSVDHFIPKSLDPSRAYEWSNYRLASRAMNSRKGDFNDVLDPFTLQPNTFVLDIATMLVKPGKHLSVTEKQAVKATIKRLKLNDDEALTTWRAKLVLKFCDDDISMRELERLSPFVAYEINRQNYSKEQLQYIFKRRSVDPKLLR